MRLHKKTYDFENPPKPAPVPELEKTDKDAVKQVIKDWMNASGKNTQAYSDVAIAVRKDAEQAARQHIPARDLVKLVKEVELEWHPPKVEEVIEK